MNHELTGGEQIGAVELCLTNCEEQIFQIVRDSASQREWFKRSDHDLSQVEGYADTTIGINYGTLLQKLKAAGITEHNDKQRGGSRYRFTDLIEADIVVTSTTPGAQRSRTSRPNVTQPVDRTGYVERFQAGRESSMRFAGELVTSMEACVGIDGMPIDAVRKYVSEGLRINKQQAAALISSLIDAHHFHYGRQDNTWVLKSGSEPNRSEQSEKNDAEEWTIADAHNAGYILDHLVHYERLKRGARPVDIADAMGLVDEPRKRLYGSIRKLHEAGYVALRPDTEPNRSHTQPVVYISDEQLIDQLRNNRPNVISELQGRVKPL